MRPEDAQIDDAWYETAFGALYPVVYAHRTIEAAAPEARFAVETLPIEPGDRVLDLCCGTGRHMVHLLERTPHVIGLDYSPELLERARATLGPETALVRGDMRDLPFADVFDVVVNFFTSFGYFTAEDDNRKSAAALASALRPGGVFLIDYLNPSYVRNTLTPESTSEKQGYTIRETRWIDERERRVNKRTAIEKQGSVIAQTSESVRLYERAEISQTLVNAGLTVAAVYGDHDGAPLRDDTPRMILAGRKAGV